jgi:putative hydrolase of the HAD superfamily
VIQAITFDVGETLLRPYPSFGHLVAACCAEAGRPLPDDATPSIEAFADDYFTALRQHGEAYSASEAASRRTWITLYQRFLRLHGLGDAVDAVAERIFQRFLDYQSYRLFDDALPALAACRARGFRVGIVSNWEAWLVGMLEANGVAAQVDFSIISGVIGYEKPDPRIFAAAVDAAGVAPAEILHIGDSLVSDVHGAHAAGLQAVLLDRAGRYAGVAARRVTTLSELLASPDLRDASAPF